MSRHDHPFVLADWDVIEPGDHVQDPQGRCWHVTARIGDVGDGFLSFLLEPVGGVPADGRWMERPRGSKVQAWRFRDARPIPGAEQFAVGRLRLAGVDVETIEEGR